MIDQETLGAALAYTNKALEALKDVVHYIGVTTTTLSDGATTNPITINGRSVTAVDGDMVFYNGTAYTWNGTAWQETLSIAQIITQIEELQDAIGNLSNLDTTEKSNLVAAINEIVADIPTKLSDLTDDATHRLVTDTEKSTWDAKATTTDITNAINALDVSSVGGTGKYISAISETDGKINATVGTMDDAPTENSNAPVKSGGIKTAIDDSVSLKTATGNPITLTDAANANAEELSMTIEPIQDLHGYTKPWPGGAVKNIAHIDATKIFSTEKDPSDPITGITDGMLILGAAVNGYVRPVHLVSYTINSPNSITAKIADAPGAHAYGVGIVVEIDTSKTYTLSMETGGWVSVEWLNSDGSNLSYTGDKTLPCTLTPPSGAKYAMIACLTGRNSEHTFSNIQLEEGTSATTFEPWENICPISGLTSGEVTRTGKNLVNPETLQSGFYNTSGYNAGDNYKTSAPIKVETGKTYKGTIYVNSLSDSYDLVYTTFSADDIIKAKRQVVGGTITILEGESYVRVRNYSDQQSYILNNDFAYQLEEGSTATPYEPYTATNATITFGQTVYGGRVNFKTGEVTVTHANIASYNGETINEPWLSSLDKYESGATPTTGAQVVYPLSTPATLTLTPAELELLKGNNTITANGAEISIKYYPDNAIGTLAGRVDDLDNTTSDVQEQVNKKVEIQNNAGFHNSIYRGKNLGTEVTQEQWNAISAGTFDDMYIGDYWTINGVNWRIAHFNYWLNTGDTNCTTHHVVLVPDTNLYNAQMNDSDITTGAYVGSAMYTTNLAQAKTTINNAFGASHILSHRELLTNAVTSGRASAGAWVDSDIELMNESMVYGKHFEPVSDGSNVPCAYTLDTSQLPLFALEHSRICNRAGWWLRDVVSATYFAHVNNRGNCGSADASIAFGVRPAFGIKA